MDIQKPIFWHQGLFLQPQHFQLQELSLQALFNPYHDYLQPHFWGTAGFEVQKAAIGTLSFNLLQGNFLFPDGTFVSLPQNAVICARSFEDAWVEGGKPFNIYLGLKKIQQDAENVTVLSNLEKISEVTTRFVTSTDPEEIKDLHEGGPPAEVKRLYYVLKIFWEQEKDQLGDYLLLPIAQLEKSADEILFSEGFIPPSLTLSGSEGLLKIIKEIRDRIASRGRQLEEYKRQKGIHTAEFGARDMVYLLALRSINRYTPLLFHVLEAQTIHPWAVYGILRQLIGELSSFSERIKVLGETEDGSGPLPNYNHQSLWACFSSAQNLITRLLDEITAGPEYIIQMPFDGTYFTADLPPALFEGAKRFYLVIKTETDPQEAVQSLQSIAKMNAREYLPILIARSLPGIKIEHLSTPPQELPKRANCLYFKIDHHDEQWDYVVKNRNLALYWDDAPEDLAAELMIVGRS